MARDDSDDALQRSTTAVEAVEGLLAYARTRRGRAALKEAGRAVALSRALVAESPDQLPLLVRALRTAARLHLERGRPADALVPAEEAVALARKAGGGTLVVALGCLADVCQALHRYPEAAAARSEAERIAPME